MKYPNGTTWDKETKTATLPDGNKVKTDANGMVRVKNGGIFKNEERWRHVANVNSKNDLYMRAKIKVTISVFHPNHGWIMGDDPRNDFFKPPKGESWHLDCCDLEDWGGVGWEPVDENGKSVSPYWVKNNEELAVFQ